MKKIRPKRSVDIVTEQIRNAILNEHYPPETRLPPERALSKQLGVNRLTLRAALAHLEAEGLLQPRHGQGVFVLDYLKFGNIDLMAYIDDEPAMKELFMLRRSLAAEAVAIACEKATVADINRLYSLATRQQDTDDMEKFLDGDIQFTKIIVKTTKSLPLILFFNSIERITRAQPRYPLEMLRDRTNACASYHALISLIRCRNPELARRAILGHLTKKDQQKLSKALQN